MSISKYITMATPTTEEKEQVIKKILERVLKIEVHPFLMRGNEVLREMLINDRSVKETSKTLKLPLTRVKQLYPHAAKLLCARLDSLNGELNATKEIEQENKLLKEKLKQFEERKEQLDALPDEIKKILTIKIEDIDFPKRVVNSCMIEKIITIGDLVKLSRRQFLSMRNMGRTSLSEVEDFLLSKNLRWEMKI